MATRSQLPAAPCCSSNWIRGATTEAFDAVRVICWPTMGFRLEGKASMKASSWRRVTSPAGVGGMPMPGGFKPGRSAKKIAEAAHLVALIAVVAREDRGERRAPEHPDLLVLVAEVRVLEELRLEDGPRVPVAAERPGKLHAVLGVGGGIEQVAVVADRGRGKQ